MALQTVVIQATNCSLYPMNGKRKSKERPSLLEEQQENRIKIGVRYRQLRKATGLSQEELANEYNLDRRQISQIENVEKGMGANIKLDTLTEYIRPFNITLKEFFAGIG